MGLMTRRPVQYAAALQTLQSRNFDPMPIDTGREQDRASPYALSAIQFHPITGLLD
jgi:hypothetical protein